MLNNPPEGWNGGIGFVTAEMIKVSNSLIPEALLTLLQEHLPAPADDIKILVCGPPPMVSAMKKAVVSLSYEKPKPVSKLADQVFCF